MLAVSATLAGCGMGAISGGLFGAGTPKPEVAGVSNDSLLDAAKTNENGAPVDVAAYSQTCPQFVVWPASSTTTAYEAGRDGDGLAIVHRGEITQTARECRVSGNQVTVKYGFSGRVLLGPKGNAGQINIPVNVFATDQTKQRVANDFLSVTVDLSPEKPIGYFSTVQSVTLSVPEGSRAADLKVYVGFDKAG
jgi:hypothetical protein